MTMCVQRRRHSLTDHYDAMTPGQFIVFCCALVAAMFNLGLALSLYNAWARGELVMDMTIGTFFATNVISIVPAVYASLRTVFHRQYQKHDNDTGRWYEEAQQ